MRLEGCGCLLVVDCVLLCCYSFAEEQVSERVLVSGLAAVRSIIGI